MLYQPLLHGESRNRMMQSKIYVSVSMSMIFVLLTALINYLTAFMRWGPEIFEPTALIRTVMKYLLSGIYMSVITLGIVVLCICTRSTWKTILLVVSYMFMDAIFCSLEILFLQKIWIGHYLNLWMFTFEYQEIPLKETLAGVFVLALYGVAFYDTALCRAQKTDF